MLRRTFETVLLGLALVVLDVRLDGVDLLPDPLGYLVAAGALLAGRRHGLPPGWASLAAAGLGAAALLGVPDMLVHERPPPGFRLRPPDALSVFESLRGAAQDVGLGAAMMALAGLAAAAGAARLALHARRAALAFAVLLGVGAVLDALTWVVGIEDTWPFQLALVVPSVVLFVLALVLLWRARHLGPPLAPPGPSAEGASVERI